MHLTQFSSVTHCCYAISVYVYQLWFTQESVGVMVVAINTAETADTLPQIVVLISANSAAAETD